MELLYAKLRPSFILLLKKQKSMTKLENERFSGGSHHNSLYVSVVWIISLLMSSPISCQSSELELQRKYYPRGIWADQVHVSDISLYPSSIRPKFAQESVLLIGDSLSRRLAATLAMYLNATNDEIISITDFGEASKLNEGGHNYKDWKESIAPFQDSQIKLSFLWCPELPPEQELRRKVIMLCPQFSTIVYFSSVFHQTYYKSIRNASVLNTRVSSEKEYKLPTIEYFEQMCTNMKSDSQLIMGVSPAGDYSNIRRLAIKKSQVKGKSERELIQLNSRNALKSRLKNIRSFYDEFYEAYLQIYLKVHSSPKCMHISVKILDHYTLFESRSAGHMRNAGDSMYHLGSTARITRMLDLLRHMW